MAGNGFQDFERIRRYAEHIYLYGFFGGEDFDEIVGGSHDDYKTVLPVLKAIFPETGTHGLHGHQNKSIRRTYASSGENRMVNSYMLHSIDSKTYLLQYLGLLSALRQGRQSVKTLDEATWGVYSVQKKKSEKTDTYANARRRLKEMKDYGCMQPNLPVGKYDLQQDAFSAEQLKQLYDYVCFAAEITYPRVPGSFLRRTLEREMYRKGLKVEEASPFLLRHNTSHNVFEEEVVFLLLDAIGQRRWVQTNQRRYLPVQLRPECRYGRWYVVLVEWYRDQLSPSIRPLSGMTDLVVLEKEQDERLWQQARQIAVQTYQYSLYSGRKAECPMTVEMELLFGEKRGLKNQFMREIRVGQVMETADGTYYKVTINDPTELRPLLRSYAPWIRILPGEHRLNETLCSSLWELYGALTRDSRMQPAEIPRSDRERKVNEQSRSRGELLNKFQSREMQFALELTARLEGSDYLTLEQVGNIAENRYGLPYYFDSLKLLIRTDFLRREDDKIYLGSRPAPVLPMGKLEREYLQYILTLPEAELFLDASTQKALAGIPPAWMAYIHRFEPAGMSLPHYPGPEGFRVLLEAIRTRRFIRYRYRQSKGDDWQETKCLPWKLEYSAYDRRWWVILYDPEAKRTKTIKAVLNHVRDVQLCEESTITEAEINAAMDQLRMSEPVVLRITDQHNALQRCFLTFEKQEIRSSKRIVEQDRVHYQLTFDWFKFDETEILRQLMHLGPSVTLVGPETLRQKLRVRVEKAMELNREPAELAE